MKEIILALGFACILTVVVILVFIARIFILQLAHERRLWQKRKLIGRIR